MLELNIIGASALKHREFVATLDGTDNVTF
jgi:hypothetical protein